MLTFYNTKILLDCEIDPETDEVWSDNLTEFEKRKSHFYKANLNLLQKPLGDIRKYSTVGLTDKEFIGLIYSWWKNSNVHRLSDEHTPVYWIRSYLSSYIDLLEAGKVPIDDMNMYNRFSYYDLLSIYKAKNLLQTNITGQTTITVPTTALPEISWALEDFLWCLLNNKKCPYIQLVLSVVERNIRELQFYLSKFNCINKDIFKVDLKLTNMNNSDKIIDIKELAGELTKDNAIYYFQSPFLFHKFDTNFRYIQKCLQTYKNLKVSE